MNSKPYVTLSLTALSIVAIVCATVLVMANHEVPDFIGYVVVAAIGAIGGIAVPNVLKAAAADPVAPAVDPPVDL